MGIVGILLLVVFVLGALFLIGIVLIQDEQGEGIGGLFGGGSATPFGSRSGNVLTRFTSILGAIFLVCAFALAWINKTPESGDVLGAARRGGASETSVDEWWSPDGTLEAGPEAESEQVPDTVPEAGADAAPEASTGVAPESGGSESQEGEGQE